MLYVGIDVAKNKHECCIVDECGKVILKNLSIKNSLEGFRLLVQRIYEINPTQQDVVVGVEYTGHYSENVVRFMDNYFQVQAINPLLTAKRKKAETLRKTKTDSIDAYGLANMLRQGTGFQPVKIIPYNHQELKSLTRYRNTLVRERTKKKVSLKRLINITFPELETLFRNIHIQTVYELLMHYPDINYLAASHTETLKKTLWKASKGFYSEDMAFRIREAAKQSIGSISEARAIELKATVKRIVELNKEIKELDIKIEDILISINPPLLSIPGIGKSIAARIIGEIGDFSRFPNANKVLAFAGMAPTIYQSGNFTSTRCKMEKRGSEMLRSALFLAARGVVMHAPEYTRYLQKKLAEGKHYYVALSHVARRLVRLMYALETNHKEYQAK